MSDQITYLSFNYKIDYYNDYENGFILTKYKHNITTENLIKNYVTYSINFSNQFFSMPNIDYIEIFFIKHHDNVIKYENNNFDLYLNFSHEIYFDDYIIYKDYKITMK